MNRDEADILFNRMKACMADTGWYRRDGFRREDLAREVCTNRTYLSEALRLKCLSFNQFVNSYRTQYAIELLVREAEISVEDVAFRSGFKSARMMNRYIKKSAGLSAHALRCKIIGNPVKVQP